MLPKQGALLVNYYAIGHESLDNYIAMISGQAPNPDTQNDCPIVTNFKLTRPGLDAHGQIVGRGCVYPANVGTVANQLSKAGLTWKGYMEDMGNDPHREAIACGRSPLGSRDATGYATRTDEYASKHDPFVYFRSIFDHTAFCKAHVVNLEQLKIDLKHIDTTPNFSYITPGLCHDGHDAPCANGKPGGLVSANRFLRIWVPRITSSPAFRKDGMLVITFDESGGDASACCGEQRLPGGPKPGLTGPGGGRVGAVVLSPFIRPGTRSTVYYNHYSLLRTIEHNFGLQPLGYAASPGVHVFGPDVFTNG
ncbi:MAG: alkaline phosphatase family protein [Rhodanobacteraceae bacterium]